MNRSTSESEALVLFAKWCRAHPGIDDPLTLFGVLNAQRRIARARESVDNLSRGEIGL